MTDITKWAAEVWQVTEAEEEVETVLAAEDTVKQVIRMETNKTILYMIAPIIAVALIDLK